MARRNRSKLIGRQLYFAYGSNLVARQMAARCPTSRPVTRAYLDRWRLAFGGRSASWGGAVADVVRDDKAWVEGVLYELDARDLYALDGYEGHPWSYTRRRLMVTLPCGKQRAAFVYVQTDSALHVARVSRVYYKKMYDAYRRLGFETEPLADARREHDERVREAAADWRRVFVYGTLLSGESNNGLLRDAILEGEAETAPHFEMYSLGGFPGVVHGGRGRIRGEVYLVDQRTLDALDRLEGHPRFYVRTVVRLADGRRVETYLLERRQVAGYERISSGDWRDHAPAFEWLWSKEVDYAS